MVAVLRMMVPMQDATVARAYIRAAQANGFTPQGVARFPVVGAWFRPGPRQRCEAALGPPTHAYRQLRARQV
ncbi:MAG: hypothetical protein EB096_12245 [Betaproteobacteria bacterium]|nr:hypothetical protein [Betaproteobacteria bacterium]